MAGQDEQLLAILEHDELYRVERVLADKPGCKTELVWRGIEGPFVRKRIPRALASPAAWRAASTATCSRIPRIWDSYELPDEFVVICDYVEGETLAVRMRAAGHFSEVRAVRIALDVCEAAAALHACGVVHRDITPNNVVLAADGAHLVDLGIARVHGEHDLRDTTTLGTWGFAAPEQFGFTQTDERSDVYAIGCLLGYMLTGIMPGTKEYVQALENDAVVPSLLADVVRMATAFEPSKRFASACAFATALRDTGFYQEDASYPEKALGTPAIQGSARDEGSNGPVGPFGMFPVAHVLKLFEGSFKAFQKGQRRAARSILVGILAALFWVATAAVGMSQTNSVSEACSVVIILTLAFVSFTILCLERPAAFLQYGVYAGHTQQEVRRAFSKRMVGWVAFLAVLFVVLVFVAATLQLILEGQ